MIMNIFEFDSSLEQGFRPLFKVGPVAMIGPRLLGVSHGKQENTHTPARAHTHTHTLTCTYTRARIRTHEPISNTFTLTHTLIHARAQARTLR